MAPTKSIASKANAPSAKTVFLEALNQLKIVHPVYPLLCKLQMNVFRPYLEKGFVATQRDQH
jgi:hypothetical protein